MIKKKYGFQNENTNINYPWEKKKNNIPAMKCPIIVYHVHVRTREKKDE